MHQKYALIRLEPLNFDAVFVTCTYIVMSQGKHSTWLPAHYRH